MIDTRFDTSISEKVRNARNSWIIRENHFSAFSLCFSQIELIFCTMWPRLISRTVHLDDVKIFIVARNQMSPTFCRGIDKVSSSLIFCPFLSQFPRSALHFGTISVLRHQNTHMDVFPNSASKTVTSMYFQIPP